MNNYCFVREIGILISYSTNGKLYQLAIVTDTVYHQSAILSGKSSIFRIRDFLTYL